VPHCIISGTRKSGPLDLPLRVTNGRHGNPAAMPVLQNQQKHPRLPPGPLNGATCCSFGLPNGARETRGLLPLRSSSARLFAARARLACEETRTR
jgi:hypothetical protein